MRVYIMKTFFPNNLTKLFFVTIILLFSNCFSFKESEIDFAIQDPKPAKEKKNLQVWIKMTQLPEYNTNLPLENRNPFITFKFYKFIRQSKQFESVNILYSKETKLPNNAIVFDIQFSSLLEEEKFHSLYFPFGILGLGLTRYFISSNYGFLLFTGLGGPDTVHKLDYKGNLVAYNSNLQEIARASLDYKSEFNSNMLYYGKEKESNIERKELFEKAIASILKQMKG